MSTPLVQHWRCAGCEAKPLLGVLLQGLLLQIKLRERTYLIAGRGTTIEATCPRCGTYSRLQLGATISEEA